MQLDQWLSCLTPISSPTPTKQQPVMGLASAWTGWALPRSCRGDVCLKDQLRMIPLSNNNQTHHEQSGIGDHPILWRDLYQQTNAAYVLKEECRWNWDDYAVVSIGTINVIQKNYLKSQIWTTRRPRALIIHWYCGFLSRYSFVLNACVTPSMESTMGQAKS